MLYFVLLLLALPNMSHTCMASLCGDRRNPSASAKKEKPTRPVPFPPQVNKPTTCCVCQEEMPNLRIAIPKQPLEDLQYKLSCSHRTHLKCAANLQLQSQSACPLCKKEFVLQVVPMSCVGELRKANVLNDKQLVEEKQRDDALAQEQDAQLSAQRVLQETNDILLEQLADMAKQLEEANDERKEAFARLTQTTKERDQAQKHRDHLHSMVEKLRPIKAASQELVADKMLKGIGIIRALQAALESNPQP